MGSSEAAGGGGIILWRNGDHGPVLAFARKIVKLNTKGPPQGGGGFKSRGLLALPPVMATARISAKFKNFFSFPGGRGVVMGTANQRGEN